jgi:hypothetical protein
VRARSQDFARITARRARERAGALPRPTRSLPSRWLATTGGLFLTVQTRIAPASRVTRKSSNAARVRLAGPVVPRDGNARTRTLQLPCGTRRRDSRRPVLPQAAGSPFRRDLTVRLVAVAWNRTQSSRFGFAGCRERKAEGPRRQPGPSSRSRCGSTAREQIGCARAGACASNSSRRSSLALGSRHGRAT